MTKFLVAAALVLAFAGVALVGVASGAVPVNTPEWFASAPPDQRDATPEVTRPVDDWQEITDGQLEWYRNFPPEGEWDVEQVCEAVQTGEHPLLEKLAEIYGMTYEEAVDYICGLEELPTIEVTPPVIPDITVTPVPGEEWRVRVSRCLGPATDLKAEALAAQFDVTPEEIVDWLCKGYGPLEIAAAYTISQEAGVPVEEVFGKIDEGMGWLEILLEYDITELPEIPGLDLPNLQLPNIERPNLPNLGPWWFKDRSDAPFGNLPVERWRGRLP
jgi:uncharacterized protein (DUF433 family)